MTPRPVQSLTSRVAALPVRWFDRLLRKLFL